MWIGVWYVLCNQIFTCVNSVKLEFYQSLIEIYINPFAAEEFCWSDNF